MPPTRLSIVLGLVASVLFVIVPAAAQDGQDRNARSPLEAPDPVLDVRLSLTGSDMLDAVTALGVDIGHGLRRVPTGIEVDATVPAELMPELEALGVDVLPLGQGWDWDADGRTPAAQNLLGGVANGPADLTFGAL